MQSAIVQMILIVVAVAAAAIVTVIVYAQLSSNAPVGTNDQNIKKDLITTESLCKAVGGTWGSNNKCS
ncbi:MAG: hypothetical protein F4138_04425 [Acidimicrobiia bacterium]|nr:hypothetical protein [Acidimicrobiia bacterium]MYC58465.1 hypothetical protein [Acidimicrobiia bacterium]MYG94223.1 hypothetical protein [Acidimicrobiia bacterium]MYI30429.1 hypothetical protein [Acidimicrobiia bacterium]